MWLGGFYNNFPLYVVAKPNFPVVGGYLPLFTEELHAERFWNGNTIFIVENLDDLEHVADVYQDEAIGVCFDPTVNGEVSVSKKPIPWNLLRIAIELERIDPDGYA